MKTRVSIVLALLCLGLCAQAARAQDYPSKPLQLIVPFPPGGGVDIMSRAFAQALDKQLNQRVVVNNRGGAGLSLGMSALVQAPADGYSVLYSPVTPLTIQPHRMKGLPYARDSVIPLCQTFENMFVVAAGPKSSFNSFQEVIAFARANPGKLRYATSGVASSPHLSGAELWKRAGVELTDVPYASEIAAAPHLTSNEVELGIVTAFAASSQKLRVLAVFANKRTAPFEQVPTTAELGYPILPSGYGGLFVRTETPPAIIARLTAACREATQDAGYRAMTEKQFQQSDYLDRARFTERLEADIKAKAQLIPSLNLPE